MAGTTSARICVLLAMVAVVISTLTRSASTMETPYSEEENLPYDMVARPAATSPALWQRRTVDLLLDALVLLREDMDTPNEDDVQRVSKRKSHFLFWRTPVFDKGQGSQKRSI
ncbi:uncharacterized protein [Asterias amurensis]|uniref:uncharacterized protein n=1 Tax=Asterias amurensis TaxID=7602 RepID=UPI003AB44B20